MLSSLVHFIFRSMVQFFCKMTLKICLFSCTFLFIKIFKFKQPNFFELEYKDKTSTNIGVTNLVHKSFNNTRYFTFFLNFSYFCEFTCHILCQFHQNFSTSKKDVMESTFTEKDFTFTVYQKRKSRKTRKNYMTAVLSKVT